ncbi:MAG: DUF4175 domain-containing protein, partial [Alphaproteobacteria bacterium]
MSASALTRPWTAPARTRAFLNAAAIGVPLSIAACALAWRLVGMGTAIAAIAIGLTLSLLIALRLAARFDQDWLIRTLDARRPDMEDSAALLFADDATLGPLQRLQRARLTARIDADTPDQLAPDWHRRSIALTAIAALIIVALAFLWPRPGEGPPTLAPASEGVAATPGIPRLVAQNLRILPPAYTGLPVRDSQSLDARVPQGSRLEWTLHFDPQASVPRLLMLGGQPLALRRDGEDWIASRTADAAFLYRVDPATGRGPTPPLHRIDAIADAVPQIKAINPKASLTLVTRGQRSWSPVFTATDDYGVAASARLRITLAIGEGENVTFTEREIAVSGSGPARDRRFAPRLDFGTLGFGPGSDMVVQLIVRDNRSPG